MKQWERKEQQDPDDIRSLAKHLAIGDFEYVDIVSLEAWKQALEHWPLLAEWQQWTEEKCQ